MKISRQSIYYIQEAFYGDRSLRLLVTFSVYIDLMCLNQQRKLKKSCKVSFWDERNGLGLPIDTINPVIEHPVMSCMNVDFDASGVSSRP